jgi:hypothetical protein
MIGRNVAGSFGLPGSLGRFQTPQYKQCQTVADSLSGTISSAQGVISLQYGQNHLRIFIFIPPSFNHL